MTTQELLSGTHLNSMLDEIWCGAFLGKWPHLGIIQEENFMKRVTGFGSLACFGMFSKIESQPYQSLLVSYRVFC